VRFGLWERRGGGNNLTSASTGVSYRSISLQIDQECASIPRSKRSLQQRWTQTPDCLLARI